MTTARLRGAKVPVASNKCKKARNWTGVLTSDEVAAAQRGDRDAQRHLYESSHQSVYRLMVRMVGVQDAEDLMQRVFLQAFRKLGQFSGQAAFGTWLYRLAVNEALQYLRHARRWKHHTLDWEPADESHHSEDGEHKELVERALAQVDPELRAIFVLREVEGMSYGDIAEALRIPEGTVGSRLNRVRRELQHHLMEMGYQP